MSKNRKIGISVTLLGLAVMFAAVMIYQSRKVTVLEVGIFAGSNWDVANANS